MDPIEQVAELIEAGFEVHISTEGTDGGRALWVETFKPYTGPEEAPHFSFTSTFYDAHYLTAGINGVYRQWKRAEQKKDQHAAQQ